MFIDEDQNILASADCGESNNTDLTGANQDGFCGAIIWNHVYMKEKSVCIQDVLKIILKAHLWNTPTTFVWFFTE